MLVWPEKSGTVAEEQDTCQHWLTVELAELRGRQEKKSYAQHQLKRREGNEGIAKYREMKLYCSRALCSPSVYT